MQNLSSNWAYDNMLNKKIAELFNEIADMMELENGERKFEVRAYRKAAVVIGTMQEDVSEIYRNNGKEGLMEIPGIGTGLADRIVEYIKTGKMQKYSDYKKKYPIDFQSLTKLQGMGSKKIFILYTKLGVKNINDLKKVISSHKIKDLPGFGEKSERELSKGINLFESSKGRMLLGEALPEAESIIKKLRASGSVEKAEIAGSIRRMKETVGDIDILVISDKPEKVMDIASNLEEVSGIVVKGSTKTTLRLSMGLTCDIRVLRKNNFGAAMQYFIGSKEHNVKVRQIAIRKGYKLSEYGLFDKNGKSIAGQDEAEIYAKLGLEYIEPEMREDRGEIELAMRNELPKLVKLDDIKGDLHMHTKHSDGSNTIEEMTKAAMSLGREYIGFTDHSKSEHVAHGMDEKRVNLYFNELDKISDKYDNKIKILKSAETDILKDGSLDFNRKTLERMDYVLGSVHTNLNMSKEDMTKRILKCINDGIINIIGHPTDRLINRREPIRFDMEKVFQAAKDNGVIMEINSFPDRLDLNDENILKAKEFNLNFSIDTDSHKTTDLKFMRYGIGTARRGWLTKSEVINTLPYGKIVKLLNG